MALPGLVGLGEGLVQLCEGIAPQYLWRGGEEEGGRGRRREEGWRRMEEG